MPSPQRRLLKAWRILFQFLSPRSLLMGSILSGGCLQHHQREFTSNRPRVVRHLASGMTRKTILHNGTSKNEGTGASVHQWRMIDRLTRCKHIFRDGQNTLHTRAIPFICLQRRRSACAIYILAYFAHACERGHPGVCTLKRIAFLMAFKWNLAKIAEILCPEIRV